MRRLLPVAAVVVALFVALAILRGADFGPQPSPDGKPAQVGTLPVIKQYRLIVAKDAEDLEKAVNRALEDDWVPLGGVTQAENGTFIQVVVK